MNQTDNIKRIFITSTKGAALLNSNKNINSFEPPIQQMPQQYNNIPAKPIINPSNTNNIPPKPIMNNIPTPNRQIISPSKPMLSNNSDDDLINDDITKDIEDYEQRAGEINIDTIDEVEAIGGLRNTPVDPTSNLNIDSYNDINIDEIEKENQQFEALLNNNNQPEASEPNPSNDIEQTGEQAIFDNPDNENMKSEEQDDNQYVIDDSKSEVNNDTNVYDIEELDKEENVQSGGGYIAEGVGGCIYCPNIAGDKFPEMSTEYISKLIPKDSPDAIDYKIVRNIGLKKIDPEFQYFIYPFIKTNFLKINVKDGIGKCKIIKKYSKGYNKSLTQDTSSPEFLNMLNQKYENLIMVNGEESLLDYRLNNTHELLDDNVMKYFNLVKACLIIKHLGYIHRDIKSHNICTKTNFRFIDFGLSAKIDEIFTKENMSDKPYVYWPFEYYLLCDKNVIEIRNKLKEHKDDISKIVELIQIIEKFFNEHIDWGRDEEYSKQFLDSLFQDYLNLAIDVFIKEEYSIDDLKEECADKFDVYSLGLVFNNEYIILSKNSDKNNELVSEFKELIDRMVVANPEDRYDIETTFIDFLDLLCNNNIISEDEKDEHIDEIEKKCNCKIR